MPALPQLPHETYPQFKKAYIDTGKVRYILREFPIGKTSGAASIALRCAKPEKYLTLFGKFMEQQPPGSARRCASTLSSRSPSKWG